MKRAPVTVFREAVGQSQMGFLWELPQGTLGRWGDHVLWFPKRSWKAYHFQEDGEIYQFVGRTEEELNTFLFDSGWMLHAVPATTHA